MALFAAVPAHAVTVQSALDDARDIAMTTGEGVTLFAQRIFAGDMVAIQGAALGFSAFVALIGIWLLILRNPRDDTVIIAADDSEDEPLILHVPAYTPAQPAPAPRTLPEVSRPARLLEAVAAARAQFEISLSERTGQTLI